MKPVIIIAEKFESNDDVTLEGMRSNPRFEGIIEDLEKLFNAYLKTWIKSNTEILDVLKKDWK